MGKAEEIRRIAVTNLPDGKDMTELGSHRNARGQQFPHTGDAGHLLGFAHPTQPLINHLA
jgi:hypothetical protein